MSALLSSPILASGISLFNNNTASTSTNFSITDTGEARVRVNYEGYPGVTTGATITVKIEKRNLEAINKKLESNELP
jgi:hypothetical protein